ncbi:hypothetical protein QYE76_060234 [Lolium multiflorum]|uniref:RING-type domain-containing protein n=1 Tax=Lolium multiflorum TaxID=4521 RepID=A0AAD8RZE6_LOLMU|nr:hypothetical protein QYE76_060234 [Lolium multiflorum]
MAGLIVSATAVSFPATGMEHVGYGIRPSQIDSLVASVWPPVISILEGDYENRIPRRSPFQNGVRWVYTDRNGTVVNLDFGGDPYGGGRFGAVPASEAEIARLPKATASDVREKDCPVCMESFQEGEEMRKMTCPGSHCFHEGCIIKWLRASGLCPMCRFALPADHD